MVTHVECQCTVLLQSLKVVSSVTGAGSWFPVFITKCVKYAGDRKFSYVYMLARKYQNVTWFD